MPSDDRGNDVTVHMVTLESSSSEYQDVMKIFRDTVHSGRKPITSIARIQNPFLYQAYQLRKQKMERDNGLGDNERQLFHGTKLDNVTKINTQGFDRSFSGKHGENLKNSLRSRRVQLVVFINFGVISRVSRQSEYRILIFSFENYTKGWTI